ncbi:MAG: hypothetical protein V3U98_01115 [Acidobacteriota bacterium]
MISLLILGGLLVAAGTAVYLLVAEIGGWAPPPPWTRALIAGGTGVSVLGWCLRWLSRKLQHVFHRRCIQCGRQSVKGSIYCAPHLRETVSLERERAELDRL